MTEVTELFPDERDKPQITVMWVSALAETEMDELVVPLALLQRALHLAKSGMQNYNGNALHPEGQGTWALGIADSRVRLAGYFDTDRDRRNFNIGGAYKKSSKKNKRGPDGDRVTARVAKMKAEGVKYVRTTKEGTQDVQGQV